MLCTLLLLYKPYKQTEHHIDCFCVCRNVQNDLKKDKANKKRTKITKADELDAEVGFSPVMLILDTICWKLMPDMLAAGQ